MTISKQLKRADYSAYDSIYGGIYYTYPKEYESRAGIVKYMFGGEDRLVCIAWTYNAASGRR